MARRDTARPGAPPATAGEGGANRLAPRDPFPGLVVLGIVGGAAVGKSTIAAEFQRLGATLLSADEVGREIVRPGEPALAELIAEFGSAALSADGTLNRPYVAERAFADAATLAALDRITHPRMQRRIQSLLRQWQQAPPAPPVIVLEAAVLVSAEWWRLTTRILLVTAKQTSQIARLTEDARISAAAAAARMELQLPADSLRPYADWVMSGELTPEERRRQAAAIWGALPMRAAAQASREAHGGVAPSSSDAAPVPRS